MLYNLKNKIVKRIDTNLSDEKKMLKKRKLKFKKKNDAREEDIKRSHNNIWIYIYGENSSHQIENSLGKLVGI